MTDEQWALVAPLLPDKKTRGEPRRHHRRLVFEAILYVLDNGAKWRNLPKGFPPKSTVHDALRDQARAALGRAPGPTAAIIDSQSAKTTEKGATGASTPTSG